MENSLSRHLNSFASFEAKRERFFALGLLVFLLFLISLVTLLTDILPNSSLINRFLIGAYLLVSLLLILLKLDLGYLVFLICVAGLVAIDYAITGETVRLLNDLFYLPLWCVNLVVFCQYEKEIKTLLANNYKWFLFFAIIWNLITIVSAFSSRSFVFSNGVKVFVGFTGQSHRFAGTALFALLCCGIYFIKTNKKRISFLMLIPLISIFFCGARTYLIIALAFVLFVLLKMFTSRRSRRIIFVFGLLSMVFAAVYLTSLRMSGTNYQWSLSHYGFIHFLTSGRSSFWEIDLREFFSSPFLNILFGRGYNFVYDVNQTYYAATIWAHNDYINILISHGFIGLFMFLGIFVLYIHVLFVKKNKVGLDYVYLFLFLLIIIFNAFFNMVYTYTIANLITPLFGVLMLQSNNKMDSLPH